MTTSDKQAAHPDLASGIDGPFVVTFTAHLPFPVGIPNNLGHTIRMYHPFLDEDYRVAYGTPFVNIRLFDLPESGLPAWRRGTDAALEALYGSVLPLDVTERYGEDKYVEHNQWVSLETPYGRIQGDDAADPFHRCLAVFNGFLQAVLIMTRDVRVRFISSHDLRPIVIIGALEAGRPWRMLAAMYMHPEATPESVLTVEKPFSQDELNQTMGAIVTGRPFLRTMLWRARAQRALRQTGDSADAIISFQIAAESLLFETYRMILIDEGLSSGMVSIELATDRPFKSFFTKVFPDRLGGNWQITNPSVPSGRYWAELYERRNSIIHAGAITHTGHAEDAQQAYWGLRDHLEERLWANHKVYPRTLYARLGWKQLEEKGWLTQWMRAFIERANAEPKPWYWPWDLAERPPA